MDDYSLVPVEHQPDFENVSLIPVDHDPFGDSGTLQQAQFQQPQAQSAPQPQPQQSATGASRPAVNGAATGNVPVGSSGGLGGGNAGSGLNNPTSAPGSVSNGDSSSFGKGLLQGTINAVVPGAYHSGLAQQQFRQGNYGAATLYGAEALADAALGIATLGASTRLGIGVRAAETLVPAATEGVGAGRTLASGSIRAAASPAEQSAASVADKLDRYLLDPDHVRGGPKADWFKQALGFTRENASDLAKQLIFDESQAVRKGVNPHGTVFNQTINVTGANGRTIPVVTGWTIGKDGVPRLNTAFPSR